MILILFLLLLFLLSQITKRTTWQKLPHLSNSYISAVAAARPSTFKTQSIQTWTPSVCFSCFSRCFSSPSFSSPPFSALFFETNTSVIRILQKKQRIAHLRLVRHQRLLALDHRRVLKKRLLRMRFDLFSHVIQQRKIPIVVVYPVQAHALLPNAVLADDIVVERHLVSHERVFLEMKRHALIIFVFVESLPRGYRRKAVVWARIDWVWIGGRKHVRTGGCDGSDWRKGWGGFQSWVLGSSRDLNGWIADITNLTRRIDIALFGLGGLQKLLTHRHLLFLKINDQLDAHFSQITFKEMAIF